MCYLWYSLGNTRYGVFRSGTSINSWMRFHHVNYNYVGSASGLWSALKGRVWKCYLSRSRLFLTMTLIGSFLNGSIGCAFIGEFLSLRYVAHILASKCTGLTPHLWTNDLCISLYGCTCAQVLLLLLSHGWKAYQSLSECINHSDAFSSWLTLQQVLVVWYSQTELCHLILYSVSLQVARHSKVYSRSSSELTPWPIIPWHALTSLQQMWFYFVHRHGEIFAIMKLDMWVCLDFDHWTWLQPL